MYGAYGIVFATQEISHCENYQLVISNTRVKYGILFAPFRNSNTPRFCQLVISMNRSEMSRGGSLKCWVNHSPRCCPFGKKKMERPVTGYTLIPPFVKRVSTYAVMYILNHRPHHSALVKRVNTPRHINHPSNGTRMDFSMFFSMDSAF